MKVKTRGDVMSIEIINSDLLESFNTNKVDYIAHCVNAQGIMGGGIAKQIKADYPIVFNSYKKRCDQETDKYCLMGSAQKVTSGWEHENKAVFNLFGQEFYGTAKRQVNYGAIATALLNMRNQIPDDGLVVGFPYGMCCGLAGGDWEVVLEMIEYFFSDLTVKIYKLV